MLGDKETIDFLRRTVLEKLEIEDKSLDEALTIFRKEIRKAVPNGPVVGIHWIPKPPDSPPRIKELKLKNVPLAVAIKYLCDTTKCRFWIEDRSVRIEPWRWMNREEEDHFMNDSRIARLEIADASLHDAIASLRDAVDQMKFRGPRIAILLPRSQPLTKLSATGQCGDDVSDPIRVRDLMMENVSVADALQEICKQTKTFWYIEEEQIFFRSIPADLAE